MQPDQPRSSQVPSSRELEEALRPPRKALASLLRSPALSSGDVDAALAQLTEVAVSVLRVERASVWRFDADKTRIECVDLYERSSGRHSRGNILDRSALPRYFAALDDERSVAVVDTSLDVRTTELADYLEPHRIGALLDAPVFVGTSLIGVVCHEHVGGRRDWRLWEELVASTLADFVALVFATSERIASEEQLRRHREELEQLVADRTAQLRETEVVLRERNEALLKLFAAAPVPFVLTSLEDGKIRLCNPRAADMFETSVEKIIGRPATDFYVDPLERQAFLDAAGASRKIDGFTVELKTAAGRTFWALLSTQNVELDGEPLLMVGVSDITKQKRTEEELRELAMRDALTGLYNRRHFVEVADQELARADRYGQAVSLAVLDVDHFKVINDSYGHAIGDQVLRRLADRVKAELRKIDVVARFGGEEFAILFPETSERPAHRVVERLHAALHQETFETVSGPKRFTVSIGLVERHPKEPLGALLQRGDEAMYQAKAEGRARIVVGK